MLLGCDERSPGQHNPRHASPRAGLNGGAPVVPMPLPPGAHLRLICSRWGILPTPLDLATQHIPVIIGAAYRQLLGDQEAHLRAQGYVLLDKPYRIEDLLAAIRMLLSGPQQRAVGDA